ncbi:MAG: hypothetical protein JRN21_08705 [Nitrososphaerota archaeon]|nr:hypothetical protein [Nitrososphaerota archaeon]
MSRLLFDRRLVPAERVLGFFNASYPGYGDLAFHYRWENLFWRRKREKIEWLEKEIRLSCTWYPRARVVAEPSLDRRSTEQNPNASFNAIVDFNHVLSLQT